ncbi:MAG: tetratricopeptide repeat protein [Coriobacteriales bacterium]
MDIAVFKEAQEAYARGDYKSALVGFSACTRDVEELSGAEAGKFFHLIGNCYIKSGEPEKAAEYYGKALELASADRQPSLLVNLGTAYLSSEDYPKALAAFEKALDYPFYPTPYKALSGIGAVQLKLGSMEEAGSAYREAALDPSNPNPGKALVNLGICFMELERPADAVSTFETALDLGLPAAGANKCRACLGQALLACGRVGEAVESFEAAVADGSYKLSAVAAHDYSMARSLRERFGAVLGVAAAPAAQAPAAAEQPEPQEGEEPLEAQEETADGSASAEPEPAEGDQPGDAPDASEEEPEQLEEGGQSEEELLSADEEPLDEDAMWEPAPLPQADEPEEDQEGESAGEGAAEDPAAADQPEDDIAEAVTQTFPVVTAPFDGDDEAQVQAAEGEDLFQGGASESQPGEDEEREESLIPSPEDTAFFTISEEAIDQAAKEERRKARRGNRGLKAALAVVIVLILLAAAGALAYVQGYGYPLQEQVAERFLTAAAAGESTDSLWNDSVAQESRESQMAVLEGVSSHKVIAVERGISNSTVYVEATLAEGGTAYYEVMMGRDLISWNIEYVELYFPSEH